MVFGTRVAFVSSNTKDFADPDISTKLHADLLNDLTDMNISDHQIAYYQSLEQFVEKEIRPNLSELNEIQEKLQEGSYKGLNLKNFMEEQFVEFVRSNEYEGRELELPSEFETVHIVGVEEINEIENVIVRKISDQLIDIEFDVEVIIEIDILIFKADYYSINENIRPAVVEADWNKHYFLANSSLNVEVDISLVADSDTFDIMAFSMGSVRTLDLNSPNP